MGCCQVSFVISVLNEIGSVLCCWMGRVVLGPISQLRHQEVINQHIGKAPSSCDPPSAEPFCTNPCIFVSAPSHLWCHLHHLVVVGVSQSNASHHSSCLSPETGLVFYSDQLTWWFCQDETSSRWPGWLPGLGAQRSGDSAIPATTSSMVAMPMDSQSPCQHMGPVVWDLLLPDLPDRERTCPCRVVLPQMHKELPGEGGHQNGASHFPVRGTSRARSCGWIEQVRIRGVGKLWQLCVRLT